MKQLSRCLLAFIAGCFSVAAQTDYSIRLELNHLGDPFLLLVKYQYDKQYIADTSTAVKDGVCEFSGRGYLDRGVYALVSPSMVKYFDIVVNEGQKFSVTGDLRDLAHTLTSPDSKENELMFTYSNFMAARTNAYRQSVEAAKGKKAADSLRLLAERQAAINAEVKRFEAAFLEKNKGSYVCDLINLRIEKYAPQKKLAANGRPDSLYQYAYYKSHFLDGVDLKDDRIVRTPFFADRIRRYLETVVVQHPDTVTAEIDRILARCTPGNLAWNSIIADFTFKFEKNKVVSYDRHGKASSFESAFVHMADTYIISNKADGVYDWETRANITRRVNILRNLLPEAKMPELFLVDTLTAPIVRAMGFDTITNQNSLMELYRKNSTQLVSMFKTLYQVNAKYLVLVFWAADCDHCKAELPRLKENIRMLPGLDAKVVAVQIQPELYTEWKRFINQKGLNFIHLYDPVHMNNIKERFDVITTPTIYLLDSEKRIKGKGLTAEQVRQVILNLDAIEKM